MPDNQGSTTRVCLVGMSPDTANLGVSALSASMLSGLSECPSSLEMILWDNKLGTGSLSWNIGGANIEASRCGAYHSRRLYRFESLWNIRLCARLGGLWNPGAWSVRAADAVLDISGGDSFTDMYGPRRFESVTLPKKIAIEQRKPLILLPQTYGPFKDIRARRVAGEIVCASSMAWARDQRSFEVLRDLVGSNFDPERHRAGVDVAFRLPVTPPLEVDVAGILDWIYDKRTPLVGLNVSGLLLNRPETATEQYGLKADYRDVILSLLRRLISETEARILLVPHVVTPRGHYESDIQASHEIAAAVGGREGLADRLVIAPVVQDPCEVKWIISQCDWFCGTRMHSTIAALSSGVPTAAISYSPKTLGVFETCAQGDCVADPAELDTQAVVDHLWQSWQSRDTARKSLAAALPHVLNQANTQMDAIIAACVSYSHARTSKAT